jgi:hypothetical protein
MQRCMKAEFVEADERIARCVLGADTLTPSTCAGGQMRKPRPSPEAVRERHVKAIQLDAGVKAILQGCNDAGAHEGLGAAQNDRTTTARAANSRSRPAPIHLSHRFLRQNDARISVTNASRLDFIVAWPKPAAIFY